VFRNLTGAALQHLPYRGSAPALQDLAAGHVGVMFDPLQSPLAQIRAGRVQALAISAAERSPALPEVPTMAEAGVQDLVMVAWWAVAAPAATPAPVIQRLAAEIARIDATPAWRDGLSALGISPMFRDPVGLDGFRREETARWTAAVRQSGATAE
jgi:tripartite-type tricarboxylate transporter receptor subunit TctC